MPKINGLDLAREIITIRPEIPIILCTGGSGDITSKAQAAGINEFVMKPLKTQTLAKALRRALDKDKG